MQRRSGNTSTFTVDRLDDPTTIIFCNLYSVHNSIFLQSICVMIGPRQHSWLERELFSGTAVPAHQYLLIELLKVVVYKRMSWKMCIRTRMFSQARHNFGKRYRMEMSFLLICRKRTVGSTFQSVLRCADVIYWHAAASTLRLCLPPLRFITGASTPTTLSSMIRSVGPLWLRSAVSVVYL